MEDFLKSGLRNRQVRWVAESPSFDTARASLQKLTRRQGKKKNDEVIPAGEYLGKVKVTGVKEKDAKGNVINCYIWFVNVLKQKEWEESETVGKPKKGKK